MGPGRDDRLARRAARRRADAGLRERPRPLRPRRPALARAGNGAVPDALHERPLERLGARGTGSRGSARRGHGRASALRRVAARQPVVGRALRPDRVPAPWPSQPLRAWFVSSPAAGVPARTLQKADAPEIVPRTGWKADEKIRRAGPRSRPRCASRSSTTRPARTATRRPGTRDREGDPALPREGERLERHRLQLPRRPLRHGLRGPLRRDRAQRRRRARGGVQHRLRRRRRDRRVQLSRGRGGGAQLARGAARLAPRPRSRRSRLDAVRSSRAATHASAPGFPSSCARSPAIATRASPTARERRSTT